MKHDAIGPLVLQLRRSAKAPGHRRGRGHRGVGQIDLGFRMAHAAYEVPVGGGYRGLAGPRMPM